MSTEQRSSAFANWAEWKYARARKMRRSVVECSSGPAPSATSRLGLGEELGQCRGRCEVVTALEEA